MRARRAVTNIWCVNAGDPSSRPVSLSSCGLSVVTGRNGIGQNGTDKVVGPTDKMLAMSIDSNSTELNFYSVTTSHK